MMWWSFSNSASDKWHTLGSSSSFVHHSSFICQTLDQLFSHPNCLLILKMLKTQLFTMYFIACESMLVPPQSTINAKQQHSSVCRGSGEAAPPLAGTIKTKMLRPVVMVAFVLQFPTCTHFTDNLVFVRFCRCRHKLNKTLPFHHKQDRSSLLWWCFCKGFLCMII